MDKFLCGYINFICFMSQTGIATLNYLNRNAFAQLDDKLPERGSKWLCHFVFPPVLYGGFNLSTSLSTLVTIFLLMAVYMGVVRYDVVLVYISLVVNNAKCLSCTY